VIGLFSEFGQEELKLDISTLTVVILMVQFVAFLGALGFDYVARAIGTKRALMVSLLMGTIALGYTYALLHTTPQVFGVAAVIAVALGGSQALSRSAYASIIPKGQEAEFFSLAGRVRGPVRREVARGSGRTRGKAIRPGTHHLWSRDCL
ncbi:MAG TPA: MFS transporter, partial [Candidatus Dormibacteraeota bacterium]